jgi:hypothetical protein
MNYNNKKQIASALYEAYIQAENHNEAQKIKDCAYELGILLCESRYETVSINHLIAV